LSLALEMPADCADIDGEKCSPSHEQEESSSVLLQRAARLEAAMSFAGASRAAATPEVYPFSRNITFITIKDAFFDHNLARSSLWKNRDSLPHEWLLLRNDDNSGIASLYAEAQGKAKNDLLVFLHSDVMLPEGWYTDFMSKLAILETKDPNWGVLGTAGVPVGWIYLIDPAIPFAIRGERNAESKIASSIIDCMSERTGGVDSLPVQSLDEHLLVLRRASPPLIDAKLPGFDLYGLDIVLSARKLGMKAYLLNTRIEHKVTDVDGKKYKAEEFMKKVNDAAFQQRAKATQLYVQKKWCDSGFLPVFGTTFDILPCDQPPYNLHKVA